MIVRENGNGRSKEAGLPIESAFIQVQVPDSCCRMSLRALQPLLLTVELFLLMQCPGMAVYEVRPAARVRKSHQL